MLLFLCTVIHFSVDGFCAAVLARYAVSEPDFGRTVYYFGLYNLVAFGGQWLAGLVLDKRRGLTLPTLAIVPVILAGGFADMAGIFWQALSIALGNCLFHVAAGIFILRRYGGFREPGIFVSSGAVGLALGLYRFVGAWAFWVLCAVFTFAASTVILKSQESPMLEVPDDSQGGNVPCLVAGALMLLVCVVLRGFGGGAKIPGYVLLMPCVFMAGKSLGGVVCDLIGYRRTILAVFILSFVATQIPGATGAVTLTLAFNMTMPLTLRLLHWYFPDYPGLTFGLAAGCLLPGAFFGKNFGLPAGAMAAMQFTGLFAAWMILRRYGRDGLSSPQF